MAHQAKSDIVTCPLCAGRGEVNKHMAVVQARSPNFREALMDFEEDSLIPPEDPFETHQTVNTPQDHIINRRSWKE
jgi:hypothetical protein